MKAGFAKQKAKQQKAKRQRQKKRKAGKDVELKDAPAGEDLELSDATLTAKDKHKTKLRIKQQLKVRVKSLKAARSKLTKLPGNRQEKRQISEEIKELKQAQADPQAGQLLQAQTVLPQPDSMVE